MSPEEAWNCLKKQRVVRVATRTMDGAPVFRTLNCAFVEDLVVFHGAIAGEKSECLGQPAVVAYDEELVDIPSYFSDPERACPATAYYESVQAHGRLIEFAEAEEKARLLQAMMTELQPEGGYRPIDASTYGKELRSVRVFGMRVETLHGKRNLGQDLPLERLRSIVSQLWKRGGPRDVAAIERILELTPGGRPSELDGPRGFTLHLVPTWSDLEDAANLLENTYWRQGETRARLQHSHGRSSVWLGLRDEEGRLVAVARGISDGTWRAVLMDVVTRSDLRGRGLGRRLVEIFLDHPEVRAVKHVELATRDGERFYEHLGFRAFTPKFSLMRLVR